MSTQTKVDVCNLALNKLAVGARISTVSDTTAHAIAALAAFDRVVPTLFENYSWPFAEQRIALTLVDPAVASFTFDGSTIMTSGMRAIRSDWEFRYCYPSSCAKIIELAPETSTRNLSGVKVPFDLGVELGLQKVVPVSVTGMAGSFHMTENATYVWGGTGEGAQRVFLVVRTLDGTIVSQPIELTLTYTNAPSEVAQYPPTLGDVGSTYEFDFSVTGIPAWAEEAVFLTNLTAADFTGEGEIITPITTPTRTVSVTPTTLTGTGEYIVESPEEQTLTPVSTTLESTGVRFVYTNLEEAEAIYTMDLTANPEVWPAMFTQAAAAAIAVELMPTQVGLKLDHKRMLMAEYRELLGQALKSSLNEPHPRALPEGNYITGRF